jgi:hypothetical protein
MRIIHYNSDESTKKYIKRKRKEGRGGGEGERRGDLAVAPDVGLNGHLKG